MAKSKHRRKGKLRRRGVSSLSPIQILNRSIRLRAKHATLKKKLEDVVAEAITGDETSGTETQSEIT